MFKFLTIVALAFVLAITIAEGSDSKKDDPNAPKWNVFQCKPKGSKDSVQSVACCTWSDTPMVGLLKDQNQCYTFGDPCYKSDSTYKTKACDSEGRTPYKCGKKKSQKVDCCWKERNRSKRSESTQLTHDGEKCEPVPEEKCSEFTQECREVHAKKD